MVPQGYIFGPILFPNNIYIVRGIECTVMLFADDRTFYFKVENQFAASEILKNGFENIREGPNGG